MTTPPSLGVVCEERRKRDVRLTGLGRKEWWRVGVQGLGGRMEERVRDGE